MIAKMPLLSAAAGHPDADNPRIIRFSSRFALP
jgi:hypothetical protein